MLVVIVFVIRIFFRIHGRYFERILGWIHVLLLRFLRRLQLLDSRFFEGRAFWLAAVPNAIIFTFGWGESFSEHCVAVSRTVVGRSSVLFGAVGV